MQTARAFLEALVAAVPYRVEIVLTDNGIQFADLPKNRSGPTAKFRGHPFDRVCREHGIEHRLTKPNHPWTNGQVERMNRTIKDATVKQYHYESNAQLVRHLDDFVAAYNFARRLKTLNGLTRSRRGGGWNWVGVVSGLFNPNDSGVGALERRPRHDKGYHEGGGCRRRGFAFR